MTDPNQLSAPTVAFLEDHPQLEDAYLIGQNDTIDAAVVSALQNRRL